MQLSNVLVWSFLVALFGITSITGEILAKLDLYNAAGTILPISEIQNDNMTSDADLVNFISTATVACGSGIWRFYPLTNFAYDAGSFPGYQIGFDEQEHCFSIAQSSVDLSRMGSFRSLGPISEDGTLLDLDQQTITLYSGEYASGEQVPYGVNDEYPIVYINETNSFVLTGQKDDPPAQPDNSKAPVFKIFWDPNADPVNGDSTTLCVSLSGTNSDGRRTKMHVQNLMKWTPNGGVETLINLGALRYFTYQVILLNPAVCEETVEVRNNNIKGPSTFFQEQGTGLVQFVEIDTN